MIHKIQCQKVIDEGMKKLMADEAINYLKTEISKDIGVGLNNEKLIEFKVSNEPHHNLEIVHGRLFVIEHLDIIKLKKIISKIRSMDDADGWELYLNDDEVKFLYSL